MPADAWITLVVLVVTFGLLAADRLPVVAGMAVAVGLLLLVGVVDQDQALTGFASSAPITIAALYVLAGAATVTGAISPFVDRILGNGTGGERSRLARLTVSAAAMSAVLPNTPLVALAAPRVVTWARRTGNSASKYLMPLSFAAVLGGVVTVIGTSTNLVISDLLRASGDEPLGVFEITGLGLPVAATGVALLVLLAPVLLRGRDAAPSSFSDSARRYTVALRVTPGGPLSGLTVEDAGLRHLHRVFLAGVERSAHITMASPGSVLLDDDVLYFVGDVTDVLDLDEITGLESVERAHVIGAGDQRDARLHEVVISERSELAGSTLRERGFRSRYGAAVLAIRRHDDDLPGKLGTVVLRSGDVLLVLAGPDFMRQWGDGSDFSVVAPLDEPPPVRRQRSWAVLLAIGGMVIAAVSGVLTLMEAAIVAAAALLVFRVISPTEARRSVNLGVVLTLALSISLGTAVAVSGLATEIASLLGAIGGPFGDTGQLLMVLIGTMVLTELLSNGAAAALMFPIAVATAIDAGLDPRAMALVVLIGASCSFLSPIGYQTNLMVYGLGGYRFVEFTRLGAPLTLATIIVTPLALPWAIPLR